MGASPTIFTPRSFACALSCFHCRKKFHWQNFQKAMRAAWACVAVRNATGSRAASPASQSLQSRQPKWSAKVMKSA